MADPQMTLAEYGIMQDNVTLPVRFLVVSDYKRSFMVPYCEDDWYEDIMSTVCELFGVKHGHFHHATTRSILDNNALIDCERVLFVPEDDHDFYSILVDKDKYLYTTARSSDISVKQLMLAFKQAAMLQNYDPLVLHQTCYCSVGDHVEVPSDCDLLVGPQVYQASHHLRVRHLDQAHSIVSFYVTVCSKTTVKQVTRRVSLLLGEKVSLYDKRGMRIRDDDIGTLSTIYTFKPPLSHPMDKQTVTMKQTRWPFVKKVTFIAIAFVAVVSIVLFWRH